MAHLTGFVLRTCFLLAVLVLSAERAAAESDILTVVNPLQLGEKTTLMLTEDDEAGGQNTVSAIFLVLENKAVVDRTLYFYEKDDKTKGSDILTMQVVPGHNIMMLKLVLLSDIESPLAIPNPLPESALLIKETGVEQDVTSALFFGAEEMPNPPPFAAPLTVTVESDCDSLCSIVPFPEPSSFSLFVVAGLAYIVVNVLKAYLFQAPSSRAPVARLPIAKCDPEKFT